MAYAEHTWECGEPITVSKLNNIEEGVQEALNSGSSITVASFHVGAVSGRDIVIRDSDSAPLTPTMLQNYHDNGTLVLFSAVDNNGSIAQIIDWKTSADFLTLYVDGRTFNASNVDTGYSHAE